MKSPFQLRHTLPLSASMLCLAVGVSAPAFAQDAATATAQEETDVAAPGNEIIVTARKRAETAHDVPISLTVLSGADAADKGIKQLQDVMQYAPDLQQSNGMGGAFRTIRGGGSVGSNLGFEQSTGLFFDEVSFGRNALSFAPLFDNERIEVLRGPQVISFGNSTTSGAVSVVTKKPGDAFTADLAALHEFNHHQTTLRGGVTIPLAEGVSIRFAGLVDRIDKGWIRIFNMGVPTNGPRSDDASGRVTLKLEPTDNIDITLKYEHNRVRIDGSNIIVTSNRANFPFVVSTEFKPVAYKGSGAPFDFPEDYLRLRNNSVQGRIDYRLGGATLTSNTAYWKYHYQSFNDSDMNPVPVAINGNDEYFSQFSQELRLSGEAFDGLSYMTGIYYQHDDQLTRGIYSANRAGLGTGITTPAFARVVGADQRADTWSGFVSLAYEVGDFTLEPSIRYSDISRKGTQFAYGANVQSSVRNDAYNAFLGPVFGVVPHVFQLEAPEHHWMPQFVASYKPTRDLNLFAKFTKGAKTGGIDANYSAGVASEALFGAEKVTSFEAGVKADVLDRTLSLGLSLFHTKYKDLQVSIFQDPRFIVTNVGGQLSKGAEAEIRWRATPEFTIGGTLTYLDARYTDFKGAACTLDQSFTQPAPCTQDLTGHRSGFSSKWYGSANAEYARDIGNYAVSLNADMSYRSEYSPTTSDDRVVGLQKGFALINARASIGPADGPWTLAIFGRNLGNHYYSNFITPGGAGQTRGVTGATLERTRQIGLELSVAL